MPSICPRIWTTRPFPVAARSSTRTAAGQNVLVVTVMAGSPRLDARSSYIESLHARWQLAGDAAALRRRAEDLAACRILGAATLHLDLPDCIYRTHPTTGAPLYLSDADIFGDVHQGERFLVAELADQFRDLPACDALCAPVDSGPSCGSPIGAGGRRTDVAVRADLLRRLSLCSAAGPGGDCPARGQQLGADRRPDFNAGPAGQVRRDLGVFARR